MKKDYGSKKKKRYEEYLMRESKRKAKRKAEWEREERIKIGNIAELVESLSEVRSKIDLKEMDKKLDEALEKETKESLLEFINRKKAK